MTFWRQKSKKSREKVEKNSSIFSRLLLDFSSTFFRLFLDFFSTFPRLFFDFSCEKVETKHRLDTRNFASTFSRLLLDFFSTFPRLFFDFSSTLFRLFLRKSRSQISTRQLNFTLTFLQLWLDLWMVPWTFDWTLGPLDGLLDLLLTDFWLSLRGYCLTCVFFHNPGGEVEPNRRRIRSGQKTFNNTGDQHATIALSGEQTHTLHRGADPHARKDKVLECSIQLVQL